MRDYFSHFINITNVEFDSENVALEHSKFKENSRKGLHNCGKEN